MIPFLHAHLKLMPDMPVQRKIIIIDDEPLARGIVAEYLLDYPALLVVQQCNDGFEGMKAIMQHQPDLVFLDIQMPKITGFELLELLEQPPSVIFTTAFDEFAIKAFEANAVDYLLKPFSRERFHRSVDKWLAKEDKTLAPGTAAELADTAGASATNQRIVVRNGAKIKIIPLDDILYLEAADDYVKIHTREGHFLKNRTMAWFEKNLDGRQFARCHRSYFVNVQEIVRIDPYEKDGHLALLKAGASVPPR